MWNALRSDFSEFVSTVADDTSSALATLDTGLNEGENNNNSNSNDEGGAVDHAELKEIMTLLRDHPGTYTEDLADEDDTEQVEAYLTEFSIDAKTDDIAHVLEAHEETVKKHFEDLVPTQVSYEEFWKRYFYRCNEERIARQLAEETERARQARAEAIQGGIDAVTNLFGGAVKAVADTIAPEAGADGDTPTSGQINFFGARGRPPFVMNTAVDESGDDDLQDDDEDDLGWGESDDEEFDDDGPSQADSKTEQIEFTDKVSEDLQKKLTQAIEERDQVQQTVQMQTEEIKVLQGKLLSGGEGSDGATATASELEEMKLKLFEKEAELAAVKSKDDDDDMEDEGNKVDSLARELGNLPEDQLAQLKAEVFGIQEEAKVEDSGEAEKLAALEQQVEDLTESLATKLAALAEATKNEDSGEPEKLADLEQQVQELTQRLATKDAALIEATNVEERGEAEKLAALEQQVQELTQTIATNDAALTFANQTVESVSKELEASRSQLGNDQASAASANAAMKEVESKLQSLQGSLDTLGAENESLKQSAQQAQETSASLDTLRAENESLKQETQQAQAQSASELSSVKAERAVSEEQVTFLTAQLEEANQTLMEQEAELAAAVKQPATPMPSTPDSMSTRVNVEADTPAFATPLAATPLNLDDDDDEGDDWGDDWD